MKIAIITDTHFGGRRGSKVFHDFFQKFYDNIFFPELEKRGIKHCIHMGDAFDNRKNIDYWSLDWAKEHVYDKFEKLGVRVWQLVGNHDVYYKNTNKINSIDSLLEHYDNIIPIYKPETYDIDGFKAMMMPWICDDNYQETLAAIERSDAKMAFGHLELHGFELYPGMFQQGGIDKGIIAKFPTVFSGHYHTRSNDGQVFYLGNPYEMYWNDVNDRDRGFHLFDTDTLEHTPVNNPYQLFHNLYYEDTPHQMLDITKYDQKILKVIVRKKSDPKQFEKYIDKLYSSNLAELKIVENFDFTEGEEFEADESEDTISLLNRYIQESEVDLDKSVITEILQDVYREACEVE